MAGILQLAVGFHCVGGVDGDVLEKGKRNRGADPSGRVEDLQDALHPGYVVSALRGIWCRLEQMAYTSDFRVRAQIIVMSTSFPTH